MSTHRAVEVVSFFCNTDTPWESCRLSSRHTPSPAPSHVLVRVICSPINPSDIASIQGLYPQWRPPRLPAVPGLEGMGVIAQVGDDVTNVAVGQRVVPFSVAPDQTGEGLWQEYITVPAENVFPVPDSISDEVAAQFVGNPMTVVGLFRALDAPKGEYLLQTAAASVLGRMFIQYARNRGVKTINIVRRDDRIKELKALGADEVINSNDGDISEKVKRITGGKLAYGAIDSVGGEATKVVVESVRDGGTVLVYGTLSSWIAQVGIMDLIFRNVTVRGFYLKDWLGKMHPSEFLELVAYTFDLLSQKVMDPAVGEKYTFDQVKDAIKKSLEPHRSGKVLLVNK